WARARPPARGRTGSRTRSRGPGSAARTLSLLPQILADPNVLFEPRAPAAALDLAGAVRVANRLVEVLERGASPRARRVERSLRLAVADGARQVVERLGVLAAAQMRLAAPADPESAVRVRRGAVRPERDVEVLEGGPRRLEVVAPLEAHERAERPVLGALRLERDRLVEGGERRARGVALPVHPGRGAERLARPGSEVLSLVVARERAVEVPR